MRGWCWRSSLIIHYYPLSILPTRILKPPLLPNEQEERIKRERPRIPLWVKQHYVGPWGKRSDIQYMAIPQNIAKYSKHLQTFNGFHWNKHKNIRLFMAFMETTRHLCTIGLGVHMLPTLLAWNALGLWTHTEWKEWWIRTFFFRNN